MKKTKWIKKGLVYKPKGNMWWSRTHAAVPTPDLEELEENNGLLKIYFATRDESNRSRPGFVDIDLNTFEIKNISEEPILDVGEPGTFDDSGVMPSHIVRVGDVNYFYYIGWMKGVSVRYYTHIGLIIIEGDEFKRFSKAPILNTTHKEPFTPITAPFVMIENGIWRMWYAAGLGWSMINDQLNPKYNLRYAESKDGIHWKREDVVCVDFRWEDEWAITRPSIVKDEKTYKMWYSYIRGNQGYRIGYAESDDGIVWERKDELSTIPVSEQGWDSEMVAYPFVFKHDGKYYMLYNGNDYGRTGFGIAVSE